MDLCHVSLALQRFSLTTGSSLPTTYLSLATSTPVPETHTHESMSAMAAARCHQCTRTFTIFRHRHRCRVCRQHVCSACTLKRHVVRSDGGRTRAKVCLACVLATTIDDKSAAVPAAVDDYPFDFDWEHPWPKPPPVADDTARLDVLRRMAILDTPQDDVFDLLCDLATNALECPIAAVSFIDETRQWFKASVGLDQDEIPRHVCFCAHVLRTKSAVIVPDTHLDARFARNSLVTGPAAIRFYAAAPIVDAATGHVLGTMFVMDQRPHARDQVNLERLDVLARVAMKNVDDRCRAEVRFSAVTEQGPPAQWPRDEDDVVVPFAPTFAAVEANTGPQLITHPDEWVSKSKRTSCHVCTRTFTFFRRKHHCRVCGEVVCNDCTLKRKVHAMGEMMHVKVCMTCTLLDAASPGPHEEQCIGLNAPRGSIVSRRDLSSCGGSNERDSLTSKARAPMDQPWPQPLLVEATRPDGLLGIILDTPQASSISIPSTCIAKSSTSLHYFPPRSEGSHRTNDYPHCVTQNVQSSLDEAARLDVLRSFDILDTSQEDVFDVICAYMTKSFTCPIAAVSFIDDKRQWFKAALGLHQAEIPRHSSVCTHVLQTKASVVVHDVRTDPRLAPTAIRFYAAAPIIHPATGHVLGTVFVMDFYPRTHVDTVMLEKFAAVAMKNLVDRRLPTHDDGCDDEQSPPSVDVVPRLEHLLLDLLSKTEATQQQLKARSSLCGHGLT
ncbi:Aste57867_24260 [Aphanomyces stellatus]|uniref:Aste57867_24260 protein n=1 Tax=Aphanomyces stellatus TaxID=120398 RepID=A0A485LRK7_9STRA|nr:hypothetical protein As57867_024185 [Aphanomyces stellatus]VFU00900.1 Aste57867_24260 [Aphanomyces stellatus]